MKPTLLNFIILFCSLSLYCPFSFAAPDNSTKNNQNITELFSYADRAFITLIDYSLKSKRLEFKEIYYLPNNDINQKIGPLSIGQALVLNYNASNQTSVIDFAGTITTQLSVNGEAAGTIELKWRPTSDILAMFINIILFRFDRAYIWPQALLDRIPNWFNPNPKSDKIEIIWHDINELIIVKNQYYNLKYLVNLLKEIQIFIPDLNSFQMKGLITHFGLPQKNKTLFILDLTYLFDATLSCKQSLRSDYNPYSHDLQHLQNKTQCKSFTTDLKNSWSE